MSFLRRQPRPSLAIPGGAPPIIAAREVGKRPADPVIVSFVGRHGWPNPTVYAEPGVRYEWRWLNDLRVIVLASHARMPGAELRRILEAEPRWEVYRDAILADAEQRAAALISLAKGRIWTWPIGDAIEQFGWHPAESTAALPLPAEASA